MPLLRSEGVGHAQNQIHRGVHSMRFVVLFALITIFTIVTSAQELPREWIDPDTGHRVVRLSDEPGSASLYFHQNPYTPDGKKLLITIPNGLATVDLKTRKI